MFLSNSPSSGNAKKSLDENLMEKRSYKGQVKSRDNYLSGVNVNFFVSMDERGLMKQQTCDDVFSEA